ncbi:MAG: hypothetical protein JW891_11075, partial [Candidatus Lokiarchaeota archaeon]|nr:hypothetical protein [Candidatus Lokiarchaeota archaeon]
LPNGYRIARFADKSPVSVLKGEMDEWLLLHDGKSVKKAFKKFARLHGKHLTIEAMKKSTVIRKKAQEMADKSPKKGKKGGLYLENFCLNTWVINKKTNWR